MVGRFIRKGIHVMIVSLFSNPIISSSLSDFVNSKGAIHLFCNVNMPSNSVSINHQSLYTLFYSHLKMSRRIFHYNDKDMEIKERIALFLDFSEKGLNNPIAYHGTSIESVEHIIRNAFLPGAPFDEYSDGTQIIRKGDIFLVAEESNLPQEQYQEPEEEQQMVKIVGKLLGFGTKQEVLGEAKGYAGDVARAHYLMSLLDLDLDDKNQVNLARSVTSGHEGAVQIAYDELLNMNYASKTLDDALKKANQRKGVIIGIKELINPFVDPGGDLRINLSDGLTPGMITGIKALGPGEKYYFKALKETYG